MKKSILVMAVAACLFTSGCAIVPLNGPYHGHSYPHGPHHPHYH